MAQGLIDPQLVASLGILLAPVVTVGGLLVVGYRTGLGSDRTHRRSSGRRPITDKQRVASDSDELDDSEYEERPLWQRVAFLISLVLLLVGLAGFGAYYTAIQQIGSVASADSTSDPTAPDPLHANIERAKAALANPTNDHPAPTTTDWPTYAGFEGGYSVIRPPDVHSSPFPTSPRLALAHVDGKHPTLADAVKFGWDGDQANYLVIATYQDPDRLEAGAFASIFPAHDLTGSVVRTAFRIDNNPAVKFTTITDREKIEATYTSVIDTDRMYVLELHRLTSADDQTSLDRTEALKTMVGKFHIRTEPAK